MLGPRSGRDHAMIGSLKSQKPAPEFVSCHRDAPMRCFFLIGVPIFIPVIAVAEFGGINDPEEPMLVSGIASGQPGAQQIDYFGKLRLVAPMFECKDRKMGDGS